MKIQVSKKAGVCILECSGTLLLGAGDTVLESRFGTLLAAGERYFVLDFTALAHMDSAGVGTTVACSKRAAERSGVIKIVLRPGASVRKIFAATQLDRAFEIFEDPDEAVASFPA